MSNKNLMCFLLRKTGKWSRVVLTFQSKVICAAGYYWPNFMDKSLKNSHTNPFREWIKLVNIPCSRARVKPHWADTLNAADFIEFRRNFARHRFVQAGVKSLNPPPLNTRRPAISLWPTVFLYRRVLGIPFNEHVAIFIEQNGLGIKTKDRRAPLYPMPTRLSNVHTQQKAGLLNALLNTKWIFTSFGFMSIQIAAIAISFRPSISDCLKLRKAIFFKSESGINV